MRLAVTWSGRRPALDLVDPPRNIFDSGFRNSSEQFARNSSDLLQLKFNVLCVYDDDLCVDDEVAAEYEDVQVKS